MSCKSKFALEDLLGVSRSDLRGMSRADLEELCWCYREDKSLALGLDPRVANWRTGLD
jgi:hypothetical protein